MNKPEAIQQPSTSKEQISTAWGLLRIFAGAMFAILLFAILIATSGASRSPKRQVDRLLTVSNSGLGMTYADYAKMHPAPCADNICTTNAVYAGKPVHITAQFFRDRLFYITYDFEAQGDSLCKALTEQYGASLVAPIGDEHLYDFSPNGGQSIECSTDGRHATVAFMDAGLLTTKQKVLLRHN
jgi:hypothetical protein